MIYRFLQIKPPNPNPNCIAKSKQQNALASTGMQIKQITSFIRGAISTLRDKPLKFVYIFTYLDSNISSTENDINEPVGWYQWAINHMEVSSFRLSETDFFQAVTVSIILYGCTTKRMEEKVDGNYTIITRAALNNSW